MKIFHVMTSFAMGGAERVACDLAAGAVSRGHQATIVALRRTPPGQEEFGAAMLAELKQRGVGAIDLKGKNFRTSLPYLIATLTQLIRREKPDILHAHVDHAELMVSLASRLTPVAVVRTIHNTVIWPNHPVIGWVAEHAFKNDYVVAVSDDALAAYEKTRLRFGLKPVAQRQVIYNGVQLKPFAPRNPVGPCLKLAFFGRSTPQKGLDILCEAINLIARRGATSLHIDLYTDAAPAQIPIMPTAKVTFSLLPPTPKARELMASYDALVIPSRFEGLPLVPLEAMASSVPIIVTDAPGLREVSPPGWPLVSPVEDADALASRIDEAASGRLDLNALGKQGRKFTEQFGTDTQIEKYMAVYCELLDKDRATTPA